MPSAAFTKKIIQWGIAMGTIVIFFGLVSAMVGMLMLIQPRLVLDTMYSFSDEKWLQVVTATLRLVLGSVLLVCAEQTRFPLVIQLIGLSTLIAGMGITLISAVTFRHCVAVMLRAFRPYARMGSLLLIGFGVFLVYAMF